MGRSVGHHLAEDSTRSRGRDRGGRNGLNHRGGHRSRVSMSTNNRGYRRCTRSGSSIGPVGLTLGSTSSLLAFISLLALLRSQFGILIVVQRNSRISDITRGHGSQSRGTTATTVPATTTATTGIGLSVCLVDRATPGAGSGIKSDSMTVELH